LLSLGPGSKLGRYEIVELLGRGGMGSVFRARDPVLSREVAVKVVSAEALASDPSLLERFHREATASTAVRHPNIVAVLDAGQIERLPYLVLELVPGGSLKDLLRRSGQLEPRAAAALMAQVARGLAAIHDAGLVHRDLKPDNVLLDERGTAKIADFGLVRAKSSDALTRTGEVLGTYEYMAPEQAEGGHGVDARADIYALGATLYALLTGRPPFEGKGYEVLKHALLEDVKPPSALVPGMPRELDALVLGLLAKEPEKRPQTASVAAEALEAFARGEAPVAPAQGSRGRLVAAAIGLVLIAAIGGAAGKTLLSRTPPPPPPPAPTPAPPTVAPTDPAPPKRPATTFALELQRTFGVNDQAPAARTTAVVAERNATSAVCGWDDGTIAIMDLPSAVVREKPRGRANTKIAKLAILPGGRRVVVGCIDGLVAIWNVQTGEFEKRLRDPDGNTIGALAVSKDGKLVVAGLGEKCQVVDKVFVWNLESGVMTTIRQRFPIGDAIFLPDGRVAIAGLGGFVHLWTLDSKKNEELGGNGRSSVRTLDVSPDGRTLVSSGDDCILHLWPLVPEERRRTISKDGDDNPIATHPITAVRFDADGRQLIYATILGNTGFFDLATQAHRAFYRAQGNDYAARAVAVVSDQLVLTADQGPKPRLLDPETSYAVVTPLAHNEPVVELIVSHDGRRLISSSTDGTVRVWDTSSDAPPRILPWSNSAGVCQPFIALHADGKTLQVTSETGSPTTRRFDIERGEAVGDPSWDAPPEPRAMVYPGVGARVIYGTYSGAVFLCEPGKPRVNIDTLPGVIRNAVPTRPDECLLGSEGGGMLALVNLTGSSPRISKTSAGEPVTALASVGKSALVGRKSGRIELFDLQRGALKEVARVGSRVFALAMTADGTLAASSHEGGALILWELTGADSIVERTRLDLSRAGDVPMALAFSPDGKKLYVGSARTEILVYEVRR
jgi:serine/threonine-protein kinase